MSDDDGIRTSDPPDPLITDEGISLSEAYPEFIMEFRRHEDAVNDAFFKLLFCLTIPSRSYIRAAIWNAIRMGWRREKTSRQATRRYAHICQDEECCEGAMADFDEDDSMIGNERRLIIRECLNELSTAHREVIELYYFECLSIREISKKIDLSLAAVKSKLARARARLLSVLNKNLFEFDDI